jgi:hypothetical protein
LPIVKKEWKSYEGERVEKFSPSFAKNSNHFLSSVESNPVQKDNYFSVRPEHRVFIT